LADATVGATYVRVPWETQTAGAGKIIVYLGEAVL
jgi:hypothetical protein